MEREVVIYKVVYRAVHREGFTYKDYIADVIDKVVLVGVGNSVV